MNHATRWIVTQMVYWAALLLSVALLVHAVRIQPTPPDTIRYLLVVPDDIQSIRRASFGQGILEIDRTFPNFVDIDAIYVSDDPLAFTKAIPYLGTMGPWGMARFFIREVDGKPGQDTIDFLRTPEGALYIARRHGFDVPYERSPQYVYLNESSNEFIEGQSVCGGDIRPTHTYQCVDEQLHGECYENIKEYKRCMREHNILRVPSIPKRLVDRMSEMSLEGEKVTREAQQKERRNMAAQSRGPFLFASTLCFLAGSYDVMGVFLPLALGLVFLTEWYSYAAQALMAWALLDSPSLILFMIIVFFRFMVFPSWSARASGGQVYELDFNLVIFMWLGTFVILILAYLRRRYYVETRMITSREGKAGVPEHTLVEDWRWRPFTWVATKIGGVAPYYMASDASNIGLPNPGRYVPPGAAARARAGLGYEATQPRGVHPDPPADAWQPQAHIRNMLGDFVRGPVIVGDIDAVRRDNLESTRKSSLGEPITDQPYVVQPAATRKEINDIRKLRVPGAERNIDFLNFESVLLKTYREYQHGTVSKEDMEMLTSSFFVSLHQESRGNDNKKKRWSTYPAKGKSPTFDSIGKTNYSGEVYDKNGKYLGMDHEIDMQIQAELGQYDDFYDEDYLYKDDLYNRDVAFHDSSSDDGFDAYLDEGDFYKGRQGRRASRRECSTRVRSPSPVELSSDSSSSYGSTDYGSMTESVLERTYSQKEVDQMISNALLLRPVERIDVKQAKKDSKVTFQEPKEESRKKKPPVQESSGKDERVDRIKVTSTMREKLAALTKEAKSRGIEVPTLTRPAGTNDVEWNKRLVNLYTEHLKVPPTTYKPEQKKKKKNESVSDHFAFPDHLMTGELQDGMPEATGEKNESTVVGRPQAMVSQTYKTLAILLRTANTEAFTSIDISGSAGLFTTGIRTAKHVLNKSLREDKGKSFVLMGVVTFCGKQVTYGKPFMAEVIGVARHHDLAWIRVPTDTSSLQGLPRLKPKKLEPGSEARLSAWYEEKAVFDSNVGVLEVIKGRYVSMITTGGGCSGAPYVEINNGNDTKYSYGTHLSGTPSGGSFLPFFDEELPFLTAGVSDSPALKAPGN